MAKRALKNFETEDLRILIGQNIGNEYLIPLAIRILEKDILAAGNFYEGDLLVSVLRSDGEYWKKNIKDWVTVCELFRANEEMLKTVEIAKSIRKDWFVLFAEFEKII